MSFEDFQLLTVSGIKNWFEDRIGKETIRIKTIPKVGQLLIIVNSNVSNKFEEILNEFKNLLPVGIYLNYEIGDVSLNKYKFISRGG